MPSFVPFTYLGSFSGLQGTVSRRACIHHGKIRKQIRSNVHLNQIDFKGAT